jgi:uroporphyrin-III C-methyltransferase
MTGKAVNEQGVAGIGKVYLVGAGPGAADLLTIRAARVIASADILFHDALVNPEVVALATRAKTIAVGKRHGRYSTAQSFINKRLIDAAQRHAIVVRLKGGDPLMFGRAQEELDALAEAGIEVEIVSGITAALAAGASLGVSLTRRGVSRNVTFVTPRVGKDEAVSDWATAVLAADTAVIYMGSGEAQAIADMLISRGLPPGRPVALVENASLAGEAQHVARLDEIGMLAARLGGGPAIIVLGEVLRERLAQAQTVAQAVSARSSSVANSR